MVVSMTQIVSSSSKVPATVWALGFVSMFMDISSEMIHALLPLFLTTTLGVSVAVVGLIEGIAEATASIVKVFSGWLSDRLGNRKLLTVAGYALGALTKPIFAIAVTPYEVLGARFADRIGKGIRGAPRDALVADVTPEAIRGKAYGVRQALDTVGAFAGPLLAIGLMLVYAGDMRAVFAWAIVPGFVAVAIAVFGVREPPRLRPRLPSEVPIRFADIRHVGIAYWSVVAVGAAFTMARFSEAFLVLRAQDVGIAIVYAPAVMVVMNVAYALVATPAGAWSDRTDRRRILALSLVPLLVADLALALWPSVIGLVVGVVLWGVHMGMSQGLLAALVADTVPAAQRGTAFGVFNLISGGVMFLASFLAGVLWATAGPQATFLAGGGFALASLGGLCFLLMRGPGN
jgi:MFS family permease